jgi:nitrate/nitrite transport system permease protein
MNPKLKQFFIDSLLLPCVGIGLCIVAWFLLSAITFNPKKKASDFPSPVKTWEDSKQYFAAPFTNNEDEGFRGIGLEAWDSLRLVAKGYITALLVAVPIGFMLGSSKTFTRMFDPIFQILRPVSPLAWLPLAGLLMITIQRWWTADPDFVKRWGKFDAVEWQCVFTIAICAVWPTILNTAVGVRAIPPDYMNVAKVLRLSAWKRFTKIQFPATLPYMFTGFRLSLGIAWLVIVAAEMLTGKPGIGYFLANSYNGGNYGAMIASIIVIGLIGFALDRLMTVFEKNVNVLLAIPGWISRKLFTRRDTSAAAALEVKHVTP